MDLYMAMFINCLCKIEGNWLVLRHIVRFLWDHNPDWWVKWLRVPFESQGFDLAMLIFLNTISCWVSILSESALSVTWDLDFWFVPLFARPVFKFGISWHPPAACILTLWNPVLLLQEQTTSRILLSWDGLLIALNSLKKTRLCASHPKICVAGESSMYSSMIFSDWCPEAMLEDFRRFSTNLPSSTQHELRSVDSCWTADHWLGKVRCRWWLRGYERLLVFQFCWKIWPWRCCKRKSKEYGSIPLLVSFTQYYLHSILPVVCMSCVSHVPIFFFLGAGGC